MERTSTLQTLIALTATAGTIVGLPAALSAQDMQTPTEVVDAFQAALSTGDSATALGFLSPDVVIFESGGAEMSREEYRSQHLGADIEFSMSTIGEITGRRSDVDGDLAWVLTRSSTTGTFRGRDIDSKGVETMILFRTEDRWKISHIHWSSR